MGTTRRMNRSWHARDTADETPSRQVIVASPAWRLHDAGQPPEHVGLLGNTLWYNAGPRRSRRTPPVEAAERCVSTAQVVAERQYGTRTT